MVGSSASASSQNANNLLFIVGADSEEIERTFFDLSHWQGEPVESMVKLREERAKGAGFRYVEFEGSRVAVSPRVFGIGALFSQLDAVKQIRSLLTDEFELGKSLVTLDESNTALAGFIHRVARKEEKESLEKYSDLRATIQNQYRFRVTYQGETLETLVSQDAFFGLQPEFFNLNAQPSKPGFWPHDVPPPVSSRPKGPEYVVVSWSVRESDLLGTSQRFFAHLGGLIESAKQENLQAINDLENWFAGRDRDIQALLRSIQSGGGNGVPQEAQNMILSSVYAQLSREALQSLGGDKAKFWQNARFELVGSEPVVTVRVPRHEERTTPDGQTYTTLAVISVSLRTGRIDRIEGPFPFR